MTIDRTAWETRYQTSNTPWDSQITPPEVQDFWAGDRLPRAGLAIDVGCGPGTNVAYLARLGLTVIGTDLAGSALNLARSRLREQRAAVRGRISFVQSDVSRLPLWRANAAYMLDIGCFHGLPPERRDPYVQGIVNNLRPGGYYQLFAFDCLEQLTDDPKRKQRGMRETEVAARFAPYLELVDEIRGNPDRYPCRWYLLRRK
ncbi:MAG: class I SAM-dependent methyltransferase [Caldilineaceae bacterium]|nr:class I SAM-dependent methyltransferase [Caldilineaceae bacterium]